MDVIQADLDRMRNMWNLHCIRANKVYANGIPDDLFYLPELRGKFIKFNDQLGMITLQG